MSRSRKPSLPSPLFKPAGWALFRAPLLPVEAYLKGVGQKHAEAAQTGARPVGKPRAPEGPPTAGVGALCDWFDDPRIALALLVGSRSVFEGWQRGEQGGRVSDRLRGKALRYLIRMSTRPTPYGLFAGVALARLGDHTDLVLGPEPPQRHCRPDMGWLLNFAAGLEARAEIRRHLRFATNPSARVRAGRVVLDERVPRKSEEPKTEVSVRATGAVRKALDLAREPIPYKELRDRLTEATGGDQARVEKLLTDLWEQTLLITDLVPPFTLPDPARRLADQFRLIDEARTEYVALSSLLEGVAAWDRMKPEPAVPAYRRLAAQAEALTKAQDQAFLQVDMSLDLSRRQLSWAVAEEVARAAELLLRVSPLPHGPPGVAALRQAFTAKYNEGREVPLLELLDPEVGLGPLGAAASPGNPGARRAARRSQTLLAVACRALRTRERVVELDEHLLADLETWSPDPTEAPLSLELYALIGARSPAALDAGAFQVVVGANIGAAGAGRNLGRFAFFLGDDAIDSLRGTARAEEGLTPGVLAAELAYIPRRFRSVNVVVRPMVRRYEVRLGGCSASGQAMAIPLDELLVGVRRNRFYLRWPVADREVRITSGHMLNALNAPDVARFLSEVSQDGRAQLAAFSWGPAEGFPFLPRVQSGRVVLRPAEWRISPLEKRRIFLSPSPQRFRDDLARWRELWDVPQHVFLTVGDNRLLLDLEDAAQAEELFHEVRRLKEEGAVLLQEVLPSLDEAWVEGPGGHYYSEFVVPLLLARAAPVPNEGPASEPAVITPSPPGRMSTSATPFLKALGSDWLYVKIYSGPGTHDDLIAGPLRDFGAFALSEGLAGGWFFLRYTDPDPHLRIRFRGEPEVLTAQLLPAICDWASQMLASGHCSRFTFDTYDREVERYGGEQGVEVAESIFFADSVAIAQYKALIAQKVVTFDNETLAVVTTDNLLAGLGLSDSDRIAWLWDRVTWRAEVGAEYRKRQALLRSELWDARRPDADRTDGPFRTTLEAARQALEPQARRLAELAHRSELKQPLTNLYASFVHMHCNRLIGLAPSAERTVLGLLLRTSESLRKSPGDS